jgi:hypothetical protein
MKNSRTGFSFKWLRLFAITSTALISGRASPAANARPDSQFKIKFEAGEIVGLKSAQDRNETEFIAQGRKLGGAFIKYRRDQGDWQSVDTATLVGAAIVSTNTDGTEFTTYRVTNGLSAVFVLELSFNVNGKSVLWTLNLRNAGDQPVEIGDLAVPLPISRGGARRDGAGGQGGAGSPVIIKHSFISGNGSFLFWMRSDSAAPFLVLIPTENTKLEYWDTQGFPGGPGREYRVYIHSAAAGATAREHGTRWRQPNTSLTLAPKGRRGDSQAYGFKFQLADDYDGVREILVKEGKIDVQVIPGMTVPGNLFAEFALRTRQKIKSVEAEFPRETRVESWAQRAGRGCIKFSSQSSARTG